MSMMYNPNPQPIQAPTIQAPDHLQFLVPVISQVMIDYLNANGNKNSIRQAQWQIMSQNNWVNQEFVSMISFAIDYLQLLAYKGTIRNNENDFRGATPDTVNFMLLAHCQALVQRDGRLAQGVPHNAMQQMNDFMQRFQHAVSEIREMKNQGMGGSVNNANRPTSPVVHQHQNTGANNQGYDVNSSSSKIFTGAGPGADVTDVTVNISRTSGDRLARAQARIAEANNQAASRQPQSPYGNVPNRGGQGQQAPVQQEPVYVPEVEWRPSEQEPYPPAVNSVTETLVKMVDAKGETASYVVEPLEKHEMQINRDKHRLTAPAEKATSYRATGHVTRGAAFETSMKQIARAATAAAQIVEPVKKKEAIEKYTQLYVPDIESEQTSLDGLIFTARYLAKAKAGDTSEEIAFRMDGLIRKDLVVLRDMDEWLNKLKSLTTFSDVADHFTTILDDPDTDKDTAAFVAKLDNHATKRLNHFVRYSIGVLNLSIDSFLVDYQDLWEAIDDQYGRSFSGALAHAQAMFIETYLSFERGDEYVVGDDSYPHKPFVYYNKVATTITTTGMYSKELSIELENDKPHYVRPEVNPALFDFVKGILQEHEFKMTNHFMVTADDVLYEFTNGVSGHEYYLITQVPQR